MESILRIKLEQKDAVPVSAMAEALHSISAEYKKFLEIHSVDYSCSIDPLYIKQVEKGSHIYDLITLAGPSLVPIITSDFNLICEYLKFLRDGWQFLLNKTEKPPVEMNGRDFNNFSSALNPTALSLDGNANLTLSLINCPNAIINQYSLNQTESNAIQNRARMLASKEQIPTNGFFEKVMMRWSQARFDSPEKGNKSIIQEISTSPVKTIFMDDRTRHLMTHKHSSFEKDWQDLVYLIDVKVEYIGNKPAIYKVYNLYPEYTLDPDIL